MIARKVREGIIDKKKPFYLCRNFCKYFNLLFVWFKLALQSALSWTDRKYFYFKVAQKISNHRTYLLRCNSLQRFLTCGNRFELTQLQFYNVFIFRSPQEFISVTYLQDKLKHATDLNNLPKLGKKNIEKSYSRIEKSLTKLSTMSVQH